MSHAKFAKAAKMRGDLANLADAVVFGTPVYYFSIAGQLKALFDRCVAKWPEPNGKPYYLVATMAENRDAGGDGRVPCVVRGTRTLGASR